MNWTGEAVYGSMDGMRAKASDIVPEKFNGNKQCRERKSWLG